MNEFKKSKKVEAAKKGENHESHACNLMNVRSYKEKKNVHSLFFLMIKIAWEVMIFLRHVQCADLLEMYKLLIKPKMCRKKKTEI